MTIDPPEYDTDKVAESPNDETAVVEATSQEVDPVISDMLRQFATAINESAEVSVTSELAVHTQTSGPLPLPKVLQEYNDLIPDGANRIMSMAETTLSAQIEDRQESRRAERRGQVLAFVCVLSVLATGFLLAALSQGTASLTVSVFGLAAMVYAFVRGRG